MNKRKPFVVQIIVVGGLMMFLYIFFALATSVYRDYKLETNIQTFRDEIDRLAEMAQQKPDNVNYFQSEQYLDKYAKENLNLLNIGEEVIIIPKEKRVIKSEILIGNQNYSDVLTLPNRNQWWEYFFGNTLSVQVPKQKNQNFSPSSNLMDRINQTKTKENPILEIEG